MTELSTPPEASGDTDISIPLSDSLISFIVAMLAPMFLCAGAGDVRLARMAALETLSAYRMQNQADLMTVAQVVAFGIATLGSLSQSMLDDLSLSMVLRLRSSANALSRSGHRHQQTLEQSHRAFSRQPVPANEVARQMENHLEAEAMPQVTSVQAPAHAPRPEPHNKQPAMPISASTDAVPQPTPAPPVFTPAAAPFSPDLAGLPSVERRPPTIRAAALSSTASVLLTNLQDAPAEVRYHPAVSPPEPAPKPPASNPRSAPLPQ